MCVWGGGWGVRGGCVQKPTPSTSKFSCVNWSGEVDYQNQRILRGLERESSAAPLLRVERRNGLTCWAKTWKLFGCDRGQSDQRVFWGTPYQCGQRGHMAHTWHTPKVCTSTFQVVKAEAVVAGCKFPRSLLFICLSCFEMVIRIFRCVANKRKPLLLKLFQQRWVVWLFCLAKATKFTVPLKHVVIVTTITAVARLHGPFSLRKLMNCMAGTPTFVCMTDCVEGIATFWRAILFLWQCQLRRSPKRVGMTQKTQQRVELLSFEDFHKICQK
jgi:hypothetical protein